MIFSTFISEFTCQTDIVDIYNHAAALILFISLALYVCLFGYQIIIADDKRACL